MADFEWNGEQFLADFRDATDVGLQAAGFEVQKKITKKLNRQGTPTSKTGRKTLSRGKAAIEQVRKSNNGLREAGRIGLIGGNRNKRLRLGFRQARTIERLGGLVDPPGGSPRKRTGFLLNSLRQALDKSGSRQGIRIGMGREVPYALIHELGGPIKRNGVTVGHMPARPYLRPSLKEASGAAQEAFGDGVKARMREGGWIQ